MDDSLNELSLISGVAASRDTGGGGLDWCCCIAGAICVAVFEQRVYFCLYGGREGMIQYMMIRGVVSYDGWACVDRFWCRRCLSKPGVSYWYEPWVRYNGTRRDSSA